MRLEVAKKTALPGWARFGPGRARLGTSPPGICRGVPRKGERLTNFEGVLVPIVPGLVTGLVQNRRGLVNWAGRARFGAGLARLGTSPPAGICGEERVD